MFFLFFLRLDYYGRGAKSMCGVYQCAIVETSTSIYRRLKVLCLCAFKCLYSSFRHSWKMKPEFDFRRSTVAMWLRDSKKEIMVYRWHNNISKTEARWNSPNQLHNTKPKCWLTSIKSAYAIVNCEMDKSNAKSWKCIGASLFGDIFCYRSPSSFSLFWIFFSFVFNSPCSLRRNTLRFILDWSECEAMKNIRKIPSQTNFKCVRVCLFTCTCFCHRRQPQLLKRCVILFSMQIVIAGLRQQQKQSPCHQMCAYMRCLTTKNNSKKEEQRTKYVLI